MFLKEVPIKNVEPSYTIHIFKRAYSLSKKIKFLNSRKYLNSLFYT